MIVKTLNKLKICLKNIKIKFKTSNQTEDKEEEQLNNYWQK